MWPSGPAETGFERSGNSASTQMRVTLSSLQRQGRGSKGLQAARLRSTSAASTDARSRESANCSGSSRSQAAARAASSPQTWSARTPS